MYYDIADRGRVKAVRSFFISNEHSLSHCHCRVAYLRVSFLGSKRIASLDHPTGRGHCPVLLLSVMNVLGLHMKPLRPSNPRGLGRNLL